MTSACVLIRLAPDLAAQFPPARPGEGPPHVTVAYVPVYRSPTFVDDISAALRTAALVEGPFSLALTGGLHLFPPNAEGETPVCIAVQSEGLLAFRRRFIAALAATHPAVADAIERAHGGYVPHATVRYAMPGESTEVDPRPRGGMIVDAVELWAGDELREVVAIKPAAPRPIALRAHERVVLDARPLPAGLKVANKGGYHIGTPYRVCTVGSNVYCITGGERRVSIRLEDMVEAVKVYEARRDLGEGLPRVNFGHQPSDPEAPAPEFFGYIAGLYLADDGRRGMGLYAVPGYTDAGLAYVAKHMSPDRTTSLLASSPEFAFGPRYARAHGDGERGTVLGMAEVTGLALTEFPAQTERDLDAVVLDARRPNDRGASAAGGVSMDGMTEGVAQQPVAAAPPVVAAAGGETVSRAEFTDLAGQVSRMSSVLDQVAAKMGAAPAVEMTAPAPEAQPSEGEKAMQAEGDSDEDEELAALAAEAEKSKDPATQAMAAKLRARLTARVNLKANGADRLRAVEVALAAERTARFLERTAATVENMIAQGLFTPAERNATVQLLTAATREVSTAEGRELQAVAKATWEARLGERRAKPAVHLSAHGVAGTAAPAKGDDLISVLEAHGKAIGKPYNEDPRGVRHHFRATNPERYAQLTARPR